MTNQLTVLINEAVELAEQGQHRQAAGMLREVLDFDSNQPMAWLWLAYTTDDADEARRAVGRVQAIDPHYPALPAAIEWLAEQGLEPTRPHVPKPPLEKPRPRRKAVAKTSSQNALPLVIGLFLVVLGLGWAGFKGAELWNDFGKLGGPTTSTTGNIVEIHDNSTTGTYFIAQIGANKQTYFLPDYRFNDLTTALASPANANKILRNQVRITATEAKYVRQLDVMLPNPATIGGYSGEFWQFLGNNPLLPVFILSGLIIAAGGMVLVIKR